MEAVDIEYRIVTRDEYDHLVNVSTFNHTYEMFGECVQVNRYHTLAKPTKEQFERLKIHEKISQTETEYKDHEIKFFYPHFSKAMEFLHLRTPEKTFVERDKVAVFVYPDDEIYLCAPVVADEEEDDDDE